MRVRFPVLPIARDDTHVRHWPALLVLAAVASWVAIFAAARLISALV
jgi:hypothetical protein